MAVTTRQILGANGQVLSVVVIPNAAGTTGDAQLVGLVDGNGNVAGTSTNPLYVADRLLTPVDHITTVNPVVIWGPGGTAASTQVISATSNTSVTGTVLGVSFDTSNILSLDINVDSAVIPTGATLDIYVDRFAPSGVPIQIAHLTQLTPSLTAIAWSIGPGLVTNEGLGPNCRIRYVVAGTWSGTVSANVSLYGK